MLAAAMALTLAGNAQDARAAFPGANGKIAFVSDRDEPNLPAGIYTVEADGSDRHRLTAAGSTDSSAENSPAWSADGTKLAFGRGGDLFVINADGTGETNVTDSGGELWETDPAWSPDGKRLVFTRGNALFTIAIDGTDEQQLTHPESAINGDFHPAWSPDGTKIVFASTRDDQELFRSELYVINADGSGETRLTNNEALDDVAPNWSPDGARIVWAHQREPGPDQTDIYVMSADGSDQVPVTNTDSFEREPGWSPDGKRIVFQTGNLLWTINPDGTDAQPLTGGDVPTETSDRSPDWGPAGSEPPGQIADLSVVKSENFDPITAGDQLTYAIGVFNGGPGAAENVVLTDPLPAAVAFVNTTTSTGACAHVEGVVTCQLGSMSAGASAVVTIVVVPAAAGTLENTATVTTTSFDPNALNNSESEQTTVEALPDLAIGDVTVTEGNAGTVAAVFTVRRTGSSGDSTVDWVTANGSATAGSDYVAASGSLSFSGPEATATITVQVLGDTLAEPTETFFVNLSNPSHASVSDSQGTGTIVDNDASAPTAPLLIEGPCSDHGTFGDDEITGDSVPNWICGWAGADTLLGLGGADRLLGGAGDDELGGGLGDDELEGGDGDDVIDAFGDGADDVDGGSGFDTCYCGPEDDLTSIERRISHGR